MFMCYKSVSLRDEKDPEALLNCCVNGALQSQQFMRFTAEQTKVYRFKAPKKQKSPQKTRRTNRGDIAEETVKPQSLRR